MATGQAKPQLKREGRVAENGDKRLTDHRLKELERRATGLEDGLKAGLEKVNEEITEVKDTVHGIDKNVDRLVERMEAEKSFRDRQIDLDDTANRQVLVQASVPSLPLPSSDSSLSLRQVVGYGSGAGTVIFILLYIIVQLVSK